MKDETEETKKPEIGSKKDGDLQQQVNNIEDEWRKLKI